MEEAIHLSGLTTFNPKRKIEMDFGYWRQVSWVLGGDSNVVQFAEERKVGTPIIEVDRNAIASSTIWAFWRYC